MVLLENHLIGACAYARGGPQRLAQRVGGVCEAISFQPGAALLFLQAEAFHLADNKPKSFPLYIIKITAVHLGEELHFNEHRAPPSW